MTKINLTQSESKVVRALMEDSRLTLSQVAEITGLNRNTVRSAINSLTTNKVIKKFTLELDTPKDEKFLLIETDNLQQIPEDKRIEVFRLSNGQYMVVTDLDILKNNVNYKQINIINERTNRSNLASAVKIYCDYCGKEIINEGLEILFKNHTYYACCQNCKSDMMRKLSRSE